MIAFSAANLLIFKLDRICKNADKKKGERGGGDFFSEMLCENEDVPYCIVGTPDAGSIR